MRIFEYNYNFLSCFHFLPNINNVHVMGTLKIRGPRRDLLCLQVPKTTVSCKQADFASIVARGHCMDNPFW